MNKILLAHTSWYNEYIKKMIEISSKIIQTVEADFGAQLRNEKM